MDITYVPTTISILSGIILAFLGKPTMKFFCLLLFCAVMFYGLGFVIEHLTYNDSDNIAKGYNRAFFWVVAFLLASIVVVVRLLLHKFNKRNLD